MRKEDLTVASLLLEAVGILVLASYLVLQVFYGIKFHVPFSKLLINILIAILVYVGLTILSNYPERVNGISPELCKGKVRIYTLRMVRLEKLLFMVTLLIPCVSDALGYRIDGAYSLIVILLLAVIVFYYEIRIWNILRNQKGQ